MPSSDIYKVKESPWEKKEEQPTSQRRHRRSGSGKTFDEAVAPDLARTHVRRRGNSGLRRFRHLMKRPEYSKKFWVTALSIAGGVFVVLLIWDLAFRYPGKEVESSDEVYQAIVE